LSRDIVGWRTGSEGIPIIVLATKSRKKEKVENGGIDIALGVWIRVTRLEAWFQTWKNLGGECQRFCTQDVAG